MILTLNKQVSQFYFPKINRKNTKAMLKDNGNAKNANNKKDKQGNKTMHSIFLLSTKIESFSQS